MLRLRITVALLVAFTLTGAAQAKDANQSKSAGEKSLDGKKNGSRKNESKPGKFEDQAGKEHPFRLKCRDGFELDATYRLPAGSREETARAVIILLHGSGALSMDEDLTQDPKNGKKVLFFKEIAEALAPAGFTVVRYHKRSYQINLKLKEDPKFLESALVDEVNANPLKFFVDDARDCVDWAAKRFPKAAIHLLGHSQGTYVALQVARQTSLVKGVALVGFFAASMDTVVFEQIVYRSMQRFHALDTDHNGVLDERELKADSPFARQLLAQMKQIDLDGDGKLSIMEYKAANYSALALRDIYAPFRKQEAKYPRPAEILKAAQIKVAFFQGLLDNQTPAYHTKSIELLARHMWKKRNFFFHYFPGLGHALDQRLSYDDRIFKTIDPRAKAALAKELKKLFLSRPAARKLTSRN